MRVVFINPELRPDVKRRMLPVGLGYVLTAVKRAGFDFDLVDMDIEHMSVAELEQRLARNKYDIYAFGCISSGFRYARGIAEAVRRTNPEALIIAGNSVATSMPELLLRRTEADIAVMGEGDITIVDLLTTISKGGDWRGVEGICYLSGDKLVETAKRPIIRDLDEIGFPDWRLLDISKYDQYAYLSNNANSEKPLLTYPLNSARGCPYSCTFCYHVFKGERYRKYSERAVVEEIRRLHHDYGCTCIAFWDELTFHSIKSIEAMIASLKQLDFSIIWQAPIRGDLLKKEHLPLLKELKALGCDNLSYSLENASPEILKAINKKMNVDQFVEQSEVILTSGISPLTSIFFGYPQETPETIQMTLDVCERCNMYPSAGFLLPLPGTPIYEWAKASGHIPDEFEYMMRIGDRQDFHINLTSMSDEEFVSTVEEGLKRLARKLGLDLPSPFKTVTYRKPKTFPPTETSADRV